MNIIRFLVLTNMILGFGTAVAEAEDPKDDNILAKRGKGVVTQEMFDARMSRIPEESRLAFLRDRGRLQDVLSDLLLKSQLIADARESNFDQVSSTIARMNLAAEEELAKAWLEKSSSNLSEADYETSAKEYYTLNKDKFFSEKTVDVRHLLVGVESRSEEEARQLAEELHADIIANPETFDQLIVALSDDPSVKSNKGVFRKVRKGQMVAAFEKAAFAMQPGEISAPVKTLYGYHIIRVDKVHEPKQQSFEEVKQTLIERERKRHKSKASSDYLSYLSSMDVEMTPEALESMVIRYFGTEPENAVDSE